MRNDEPSEVFENFIKIIKSEKKQEPVKARAPVKTENIYNVEVDPGIYKKFLMEEAHPNKIIVAPSYDPVNSLVENNIERQRIMLNIVNKPPTGQNTYQKYSEKHTDLVLSLIKVANELDFANKDQLRILADSCIDDLKKKELNKIAVGPLAIAGGVVGGVSLLIGLLYAQQHLPKSSQGLEINYKNLVEEISDITEKHSFVGGGVGYAGLKGTDYVDSFVDVCKELKNRVDKVYAECSRVEKIIAYLDKPRSASEAIEMANQESMKNIPKVYEMFKKLHDEYSSYFNDVARKFTDQEFKLRQIKDKGWLDEVFSFSVGGKSLVSDDFDDVAKHLSAFKKSFDSFLSVLSEASKVKDKANVDLNNSVQTENKEKPETKSENKPIESTKKNNEEEEFLKQIKDFTNKAPF